MAGRGTKEQHPPDVGFYTGIRGGDPEGSGPGKVLGGPRVIKNSEMTNLNLYFLSYIFILLFLQFLKLRSEWENTHTHA